MPRSLRRQVQWTLHNALTPSRAEPHQGPHIALKRCIRLTRRSVTNALHSVNYSMPLALPLNTYPYDVCTQPLIIWLNPESRNMLTHVLHCCTKNTGMTKAVCTRPQTAVSQSYHRRPQSIRAHAECPCPVTWLPATACVRRTPPTSGPLQVLYGPSSRRHPALLRNLPSQRP